MPSEDYSAKDIIALSGTQGVRKRPAMYIGSTGSQGFLHLLFEVLDNSVDEALAGHAKNITIRITNEDGVDIAEVSDDGRGIPVDIMPKYNKPAIEVIMTSLHTGGKFDNKSYKVSGGLHGVGLTVVNSLSEYVEATIKKDGKVYRQKFSRGTVVSPLETIGETAPGDTGTSIKFKPDKEIFSVRNFETLLLTQRLRDTSFLNSGLKIMLIDARESPEQTTCFLSQNGMRDFIEHLRDAKTAVTKPILIRKEVESTTVDVALQYVEDYSEELVSFVNSIRTAEGGTHVVGFHAALTRAITNYMQKNPHGKRDEVEVTGDDTREGLRVIISVYMQNPEFEGQTKEKLGNASIKGVVDNVVYTMLYRYMEENPSDANAIVSKAVGAASARLAARKAKDLARKKSVFDSAILPGKLADCIIDDPDKSEIFIVEGESAGGSSKQGRDKNIQAILPLRGKILNVEKASDMKVFENLQINTLVAAIGTGIRESFDPSKVRYKKIIIMSDADVDGSHIRTLLLTFFYQYMRPLIEAGYVYGALPPLYKVWKGKEIYYCYTDAELDALKQKLKDKSVQFEQQRYKGLGEMNPEQLWETTMDPSRRKLKQITISDAERASDLFTVLMGVDVVQRRKFLEEHAGDVKFLDI